MIVNGEEKQFDDVVNILGLLSALNLEMDRVVVEVNKNIIAKDIYESFPLKEDDVIEIVGFVGGG